MLYDCKRISYRIDWRLSGLAGPDYDAPISFGLPFEPEDSQYGKSRFSASASTIDRLLRPVRDKAGSRRRQKRKRKVGSQIPVRTFTDWNEPRPGYLEIDLVAHGGGGV